MEISKIYSRNLSKLPGDSIESRVIAIEENIRESDTWRRLEQVCSEAGETDPAQLARDEDFWDLIARSIYEPEGPFLNLNHGSINTMPIPVIRAQEAYTRLCNELPGYWFFEGFNTHREKLRAKLAVLLRTNPEEVSIQRNTSSAMETAIFGIPISEGDEVILSKQDYPTLVYAWKQREIYDGVKLKWVDVPLPSEDDDALIQPYLKAITEKTRVIQVMEMFNWNGQIVPVEKLRDKIGNHDIALLVDGAHIPGQLPVNLEKAAYTYWGASLHKWISGPVGTGVLSVRKDWISRTKPLFGASDPRSDDIRKYENFGIHNTPKDLALHTAIDLFNLIGEENKRQRLHYLKNYALERLSEIKKVQIKTSLKPQYSCALGMFSINDMPSEVVGHMLFDQYKIYNVAPVWGGLDGVRISPNIYHSTADMDRLVEAVNKIAKA